MKDIKPCPECGSTNIHAFAFSIDEDCRIECQSCGYNIETEVSWENYDTVEEHDKACLNKLKELWNNI